MKTKIPLPKVSLRAKFQYLIDNFMVKGGLSIFLSLLLMFFVTFLFMFILRFLAGLLLTDQTIQEINNQLWRVFLQISDAGAIAEDQNANYLNKTIGVVTIFLGLIFFSSMIAFITIQFEAKIASLRKGRSRVIERGHTVILGFGNRVFEIVRELIEANESGKGVAIVVLSDSDKEVMDDFFHDYMQYAKTTRIITRSGSTSSIQTLEKMGIQQCKSIIILNSATVVDSYEKRYTGDAKVLKSIMAVASVTGSKEMPPIVAELFTERNRKLAESVVPQQRITALDANYLLAKMLVQTSRNSGLAFVYSQLVGFVGDEIYIYKPAYKSEGGEWHRKSFGELQWHFKQSTLLGFLRGKEIFINPSPDFIPSPDDKMIILATDDSAIKYYPKPVISPKPKQYALGKRKGKREKQMIIGWSSKTHILIDEYAQYVLSGSQIDVIVVEVSDKMKAQMVAMYKKYPNMKIRLIRSDIHEPHALEKLQPENYNSVIILAEGSENQEEEDAETIAKLLELRQYFHKWEEKEGKKSRTQLITEVMDSENAELIYNTGAKDFLIPNQFISKIMAQISEDPSIKMIYENLFSAKGSEVYLKPASLYYKQFPILVTFADCVLAAQRRRETCIGIRRHVERLDPEKSYGIHLIPDRAFSFELSHLDELVVLAEDES